jgi:hypothetical protein
MEENPELIRTQGGADACGVKNSNLADLLTIIETHTTVKSTE